MISILIPVYNVSVTKLVIDLHQQLNQLNISGEILVYDDCSEMEFKNINKEISTCSSVIYKELEKNYGRIAIRSLLAQNAANNWLLFIDSDCQVIDDHFLKTYINFIEKGYDVITGGTVYQTTKPACSKRLHWKYGKEREVISENKKSFRTNNFCIKKNIFQNITISTSMQGYGHEDTFIGIALLKTNARIAYINNPVLHNGLEDAETFISKSLNALVNLKTLAKIIDDDTLQKQVTLFKAYLFLKKGKLSVVVMIFYRLLKKQLHQNLTSCNPSLILFDFYRLANFIQLMKRRED